MLPIRADMESAPTKWGMVFAPSPRCLQRRNTKAEPAIKQNGVSIYKKVNGFHFLNNSCNVPWGLQYCVYL